MGLGQRTIGIPALVVMIIAASAPLTVVAGGVSTNFAVTGMLGVPLSFVVLGVVLLIFSLGYTAMSRQISNAGAFYAYIAEGLGKASGVGAAMVAVVSYNLMQIGIYGLFGFASASFAGSLLGWDIPWWVGALAGWLVVGVLGLNRVDFSAKLLGIVVALEFLIVTVYDIIAIAQAPEGLDASGFTPTELFAPGLGAVLAFSIAAFMGFESGTIYNEEVKDPKRTARWATLIAVSIIAVFYAFSAWSVAMGEGSSNVVAAAGEFGPDLIFVFLGKFAPTWFVDVANLMFITSLFAALLAFHNVVARYFYAMGRGGALPSFLARTSRRSHSPIAGSMTQSVLALLVIIIFAIVSTGKEPLFIVLTMFTWMTNAGAYGLVLLMALTSFAVLGYFAKRRTGDSLITRVIAPLAAGLMLGYIFIQIVVNFDVLIGLEEPGALPWVLQGIVILPGVIAFLIAQWVRTDRHAVPADDTVQPTNH
ncbi:APC family permease [Glutamicibacter sp. PS]|uniref:APC family permease n=1 Tax=Glutamicibacter sp. PS TaxID=3075634 RepID=UPI002847F39C|nr:APC family permease [Glutamicibacter sp. PS]MDR4531952.1 APC family permease [Glutamicibacter sp. PS]